VDMARSTIGCQFRAHPSDRRGCFIGSGRAVSGGVRLACATDPVRANAFPSSLACSTSTSCTAVAVYDPDVAQPDALFARPWNG